MRLTLLLEAADRLGRGWRHARPMFTAGGLAIATAILAGTPVWAGHGSATLVAGLVEAQPPGAGVAREAPRVRSAPIVIGLDADLSKAAARSGESIRRGALVAIDEINAAGGVLGRALILEISDHRGVPARGRDNVEMFASMPNVVAVLGGYHTPVVLAELAKIHEHEMVFLVPWAAGTPIVDNGFEPSFVFRVSVRDEFAGKFLVDAAYARGLRKLGLLLWRTGWGRSNERAIRDALRARGAAPVDVQWFNSGQREMRTEIEALMAAGAQAILLVSPPPEGLVAIRELAAHPEYARLPVISHWGITGGDFHAQARDFLGSVDLTFLQTFSFLAPTAPARAAAFQAAYCERFGPCTSSNDIIAPTGSAHAYDLVHLLARAISHANSTDRRKVRDALERINRHEGLVRTYEPPFAPDRHDALDAADYRLSRYDASGAIVPAE